MSNGGDRDHPQAKAMHAYRTLLDKVDTSFNAIRSRHPSSFRCGKGCSQCCRSQLSVSEIEATAIAEFLAEQPELCAHLVKEEARKLNTDSCAFLDVDGSCQIYEARPVVCRSHGAPIKVTDDGQTLIDCCPLNFETGFAELGEADVIDIQTLNTILSAINIRFGSNPNLRVPLKPSAFIELEEESL